MPLMNYHADFDFYSLRNDCIFVFVVVAVVTMIIMNLVQYGQLLNVFVSSGDLVAVETLNIYVVIQRHCRSHRRLSIVSDRMGWQKLGQRGWTRSHYIENRVTTMCVQYTVSIGILMYVAWQLPKCGTHNHLSHTCTVYASVQPSVDPVRWYSLA